MIDPSAETLDRFVASLAPDDFYFSAEAARAALRTRGRFNVISLADGGKADRIVRKDRAFSVSEFSRRRETTLYGVRAFILSAEDLILSKLEWAAAAESQRQREDAFHVAETFQKTLDLE